MTTQNVNDSNEPRDPIAAPTPASNTTYPPTLAEDLLLLLFLPKSGTIAGENTLFYALGGAVLSELALAGRVEATDAKPTGTVIRAVGDDAPADPLVRPAWEYMTRKPRSAQAIIAAVGPNLREPTIQRLVDRGDLVERAAKTLGIFTTTELAEGDTGRRAELISAVRDALVGSGATEPRLAALCGLVFGSGMMPQLDPDIPWQSDTYRVAEAHLKGDWGAGAAAQAVANTIAAGVINSLLAAGVFPARP